MTSATGEPPAGAEEGRIPFIEERVEIGKEVVEVGRVSLTSSVTSEDVVVDEELARVEIRTERIPVDLLVDEVPVVRVEPSRTIVPVFEEVLVRRFHVTEEVHLIREEREERVRRPVTLRRTQVEVDRSGGEPAESI